MQGKLEVTTSTETSDPRVERAREEAQHRLAKLGEDLAAHRMNVLVAAFKGAYGEVYDVETARRDGFANWPEPKVGPVEIQSKPDYYVALSLRSALCEETGLSYTELLTAVYAYGMDGSNYRDVIAELVEKRKKKTS